EAVGGLVEKDVEVARQRVGGEGGAGQAGQAVEAEAEGHGPGAEGGVDGGRQRQHGGTPSRAKMRASSSGAQPGPVRRTAPEGRARWRGGASGRRRRGTKGRGSVAAAAPGPSAGARRRFQP